MKTLPDAVRANLERYRKLGAVADRPEGPMFLAPYAAEAMDDATPPPELDVAFLGARLAEYPARTLSNASRLEELRAMAARAGIPEEYLRDDTGDQAQAGFADRLMTLTGSDETRDRYGDRILTDGTLEVDGTTKKYGRGWQLKDYMAMNTGFLAM